MKTTKQILFLYFALNTIGAVSADTAQMNDEEAHLMAIASTCAYKLDGLNDEQNIKNCFLDHNSKNSVDYIYSFISTSSLGIDAYYLAKTNDGRVILSFRGTLPPPSEDNKVDDYFKLIQIKYDWLNDAAIELVNNRHKGFSGSWNRLKISLDKESCSYNKLKIAEELDKSNTLLITGHSKGAALATLAAFDIATGNAPIHKNTDKIHIYTFEGPRVFDKIGADEYNNVIKANHWRHEFNNDIVPHLPPGEDLPEDKKKMLSHLGAILGLDLKNLENKQYQHVGQLKYLDEIDNKKNYAKDDSHLKAVRLKNQLQAMQPKISATSLASISSKLFSVGKENSSNVLSEAMIEIKESYQINAHTLIDDHALCHWETYFKHHVVTDCDK